MRTIARNKYPEETIERILDVSLELFIKNGYENTSIQDIVNHLGGLTKGAIYHHFKSKEKILEAVAEKLYYGIDVKMKAICNDHNLTGIEKLKKMFQTSLANPHQDKIFSAAPNLLNNPDILAIELKTNIEEVVPKFIQPVIEEGMRDGSIETKYPKELAEVMMLLLNFWLNPLVYPVSSEEIIRKIEFYDLLQDSLGIKILDEEMYQKIEKFTSLSTRQKSKS